MMEVIESNMTFRFRDDATYHIEKSSEYEKVKSKGVSCVELITLHRNCICFIEAKSSISKEENESQQKFWNDIRKKDIDSLLMLSDCIIHGRLENVGEGLKTAFCDRDVKIKFVLIFDGLPIDVCQALNVKYRECVSDIQAIYKAEVIVLNDYLARKQRLIV